MCAGRMLQSGFDAKSDAGYDGRISEMFPDSCVDSRCLRSVTDNAMLIDTSPISQWRRKVQPLRANSIRVGRPFSAAGTRTKQHLKVCFAKERHVE